MMDFHIEGRSIRPGKPAYIIAELSANHGGNLDEALALVREAKAAGADAVKLQTYLPGTITLDCDAPWFRIAPGTQWAGKMLFDLYQEAYTPWEWHLPIKQAVESAGLDFMSTPFDPSAVAFLAQLGVAALKIASFELVDLDLIQCAARTGLPMILSTGMASLAEIEEAVAAARGQGCTRLALLKCTSAYPAPPESMNLRTIPHLSESFGLPVGLSDHTLALATPIAAVTLGACIIEKHLTRSRAIPGPDAAFSLEPHEFKAMVDGVRTAEKAVGVISYQLNPGEEATRQFRRSLFVTADLEPGQAFTRETVRSIRPGVGLHPRHLPVVLGAVASRRLSRGTPLDWTALAH